MTVAFISGHTNLTPLEFQTHYHQALDTAIQEDHDYVIGHSGGGDQMGLNYLFNKGVDPSKITIYVYDRYNKGLVAKYSRIGVNVKDEQYGTYTQRDSAMTRDSDYDILWVRSEEDT